MAGQLEPELLEEQVTHALDLGRQRAGLSVDEVVRRLRPLLRLPDVEPTKSPRHNWYDWRRRPQSIPAIALVAIAKLAGTSLDSLLESESVIREAEPQLARLQAELDELHQLLAEAGITQPREGRPEPSKSPQTVNGRLASIEHQLANLAQKQDYLSRLVDSLVKGDSAETDRRVDTTGT